MNRKWILFAEENGAPELADERLIGEPLWRYVEGSEVTRIYREVFWRSASSASKSSFPFAAIRPTCAATCS
jgi:hypothetical protein